MRFFLTILVMMMWVVSCDFPGSEEDQQAVARVGDRYLYLEDLKDRIPDGLPESDSAAMARSIINQWARKQVLVMQAEANLDENNPEIQRKLEEYRNDLLIFTYEREWVSQKLDTNVTREEIEEYYNEHQQNFELKDFIVKVLYVKLDSNAPRLREVKKLLMSDDPDDRLKLEDYCYQFAVNFYLDQDNWLYLDDLLKEIPVDYYSKEQLLRKNKLIELYDNGYHYLVRVVDFRMKDSISPLSLEYENIRRIILNKRKLEMIDKLENELFEQAKNNRDFEVYEIN